MFTDEDLETIDLPHADPLLIKLKIEDAIVSQVLIDGGSSTYIKFWSALQRMGVNKGLVSPANT